MGVATIMTHGSGPVRQRDHPQEDKSRLAAIVQDYIDQCNASPGDGVSTTSSGGNVNNAKGKAKAGVGGGPKLKCPASISRLRVEKIEGGLMVAGVVVAANCQLALPAFGFLFVLVGAVLTAASYRGPGVDEDLDSYAARIAFTGNSRVLGPICMAVGGLMLGLGALLCALTRRARRRERRVGFHCPLHGDFYPLSPTRAARMLGKDGPPSSWRRMFCLRSWGESKGDGKPAPQCPHSVLSSTRSSVSSSPLSPCPTPMPFLVTSNSMSGMVHIGGAHATMSPDQNFGSIRSLSVTREVASFPLSRSPTPTSQHRLVPAATGSGEEAPPPPVVISVIPDSPEAQPPPPPPTRRCVSIVLPEDQLQQHMGLD